MGGARHSFALDGRANTEPDFNTSLFLRSIDALQEFQVESGLFPAEYGRAIAPVNATTKSGANDFHGTAFQFPSRPSNGISSAEPSPDASSVTSSFSLAITKVPTAALHSGQPDSGYFGQGLNDLYPLPNNTGATGLANNYINNEGRKSDGH